jgi:hypothetical protein
MPRKKKLDAFHWHEALDRSMLAFEFFSERVADHDAIRSSPKLNREAAAISKRLFRLYQMIGQRSLKP